MNRTKNRKPTRRKAIPLHFQKSHTSLSQILATASYKRRIKELLRNNKILAVSLQDARCEVAESTKLLQQCSNDHTKIKLAKLRLKDMATSIQVLVTGLDEVMSYLDLKPLGLYTKTPADGVRLKIKEPDMQQIDESSTSILSDPSAADITIIRNSVGQEKEGPNPSQVVQSYNKDDDMTEIYDCQASLQRINDELKDALSTSQEKSSTSVGHVPAVDSVDSPSTPQLELCHSAENVQLMHLDLQSQNMHENITPKSQIISPHCFQKNDKAVSKIPILKFEKQNPLLFQPNECRQPATAINRKTFVINVEKNPQSNSSVNGNTIADNFDLDITKFRDRRGTYVLSSAPKPVNSGNLQKSPTVVQANLPLRTDVINETVILCEDMELTEVLPIQNLPIIENKFFHSKSHLNIPRSESPIKSLDECGIIPQSSPMLIKSITKRANFVEKALPRKEVPVISKIALSRKNCTESMDVEQKNSLSKSPIKSKSEKIIIPEVLNKKDVVDKKSTFQSQINNETFASKSHHILIGDLGRKSPRIKSNSDNYKFLESKSDSVLDENFKESTQCNLKIPRRKSLKPSRNRPYTFANVIKTCDPIDKGDPSQRFNSEKLIGKKNILNFTSSFETDDDSPLKLNTSQPSEKETPQSPKILGSEVIKASDKAKKSSKKNEKLTKVVDEKLVTDLKLPSGNLIVNDKQMPSISKSKDEIDPDSSILDLPSKQMQIIDQTTAHNAEGALASSRKSCMKNASSPFAGNDERISRASISRKSVRFNLNECILAFQSIKTQAEKSKSFNEDKVMKNGELEQASSGIFSMCHDQAIKKKLSHVRSSLKNSKASGSKSKLSNSRKKHSNNICPASEAHDDKLNEVTLKNVKEGEVNEKENLIMNLDSAQDKSAGGVENSNLSSSLILSAKGEDGKRTFSGICERRSKKRATDTSIDLFDDIENIINPEIIAKHSAYLEQHAQEKATIDCEKTEICNLQNVIDKSSEPNLSRNSDKDEVVDPPKSNKKGKKSKDKKAKDTKERVRKSKKGRQPKQKVDADNHSVASSSTVTEFTDKDVLNFQTEKENSIKNNSPDKGKLNSHTDSVPLKTLQLNVSGKDPTVKGSSREKTVKKQSESIKGKNLSTMTESLTNFKDSISSTAYKQLNLEKKEGDISIKSMQPCVLLESLSVFDLYNITSRANASNHKDSSNGEEGRPRRGGRPVCLKEPSLNKKLRR